MVRDVMRDSIEQEASQVIHDLERFLSPFVVWRLLHHFWGCWHRFRMIKVFAAIQLEGNGNTAALAGVFPRRF